MIMSSPLRYPGGKSSMTGLLQQIRQINGLGTHTMAEPFAGGAGASLSLLYMEETPEIFVNDADRAIADFWWSVTTQHQEFASLLRSTRVNMTEWRRQRDTYRDRRKISRLRRGFATFYLNRCNRSGIVVSGGPIGGINQTGKWKLDARYNKKELLLRFAKIAEYSGRIHTSGQDGLNFIEARDAASTFFFIDPPYFDKGKTLYLNALDDAYHAALSAKLKKMKDDAWVLTYDDCPEIRKLYRGWAKIRSFSLGYAASDRRKGQEIMIVPKWMRLPTTQSSDAIGW
jgi:DNA adenine methylase